MILTEDITVHPTVISDDIRQTLETFQEALAIVYDFYHSNKRGDKRGQIESARDFKRFKMEMKRFHNYPYMAPVVKQIQQIQKEMIDQLQAKRQVRRANPEEFSQSVRAAMTVWNQRDPRKAIQATQSLKSFASSSERAGSQPLKYKFNPFYRENPLFFGTDRFLEVFEQNEIRTVIERDLDVYRYSYLPLNELSQNDFQYIAYFILNLKNSQDEVELSGKSLRKYFDMSFGGDEYNDLISKVKQYLRSNQKKLIPEILELMKRYPEILEANEKAKQNIDYVYRGYPYDPDFQASTAMRNSLAGSKRKSVAMTFALQIGHLEDPDNRRSELGYIDTYQVTPDAILLDTTIFGGIFNEDEVVFNPSKAKLVDKEEV